MLCTYCDKNRFVKWKDKCVQCYKRFWKKTEKGKLCTKKYESGIKGKATRLKQVRKYQASTKGQETIKAYSRSEEYSVYYKDRCARRRAKQKISKLSNLHKNEIRNIYKNCPKDKVVDHIVPLTNELVSGLHVPWNLQYLTKSENSSKHNSFDNTFSNNSWRKRGK